MMFKYLFIVFLFGLEICNSIDCDDAYYYKPKKGTLITAEKLFEDLKPTVKNLDLSNHPEVDDDFIKILSLNPKADGIVNIDLSGTSVSKDSLVYILGSKTLGTRRELPQISGRYGKPSAEIYLDVSNTKIKDTTPFEKPVGDVDINYQRSDGKKTAESARGIKFLSFNENQNIKDRMANCSNILEGFKVVKKAYRNYGLSSATFASNLLTDFVNAGDDIDDIDEVIEGLMTIDSMSFNRTIEELRKIQNTYNE